MRTPGVEELRCMICRRIVGVMNIISDPWYICHQCEAQLDPIWMDLPLALVERTRGYGSDAEFRIFETRRYMSFNAPTSNRSVVGHAELVLDFITAVSVSWISGVIDLNKATQLQAEMAEWLDLSRDRFTNDVNQLIRQRITLFVSAGGPQ